LSSLLVWHCSRTRSKAAVQKISSFAPEAALPRVRHDPSHIGSRVPSLLTRANDWEIITPLGAHFQDWLCWPVCRFPGASQIDPLWLIASTILRWFDKKTWKKSTPPWNNANISLGEGLEYYSYHISWTYLRSQSEAPASGYRVDSLLLAIVGGPGG
jgi:hypothetical protein